MLTDSLSMELSITPTAALLLFLLLQPADAQTYGGCPCGWSKFGGKCYYLLSTPLPRHEGRAFCQQSGGDVVSILSREENRFILSLSFGADSAVDSSYWIGLEVVDGVTMWMDGSSLSYINTPTGAVSSSYHAACFYMSHLKGTWILQTSQCNSTTRPTVCKKEPIQSNTQCDSDCQYCVFMEPRPYSEAASVCWIRGGNLAQFEPGDIPPAQLQVLELDRTESYWTRHSLKDEGGCGLAYYSTQITTWLQAIKQDCTESHPYMCHNIHTSPPLPASFPSGKETSTSALFPYNLTAPATAASSGPPVTLLTTVSTVGFMFIVGAICLLCWVRARKNKLNTAQETTAQENIYCEIDESVRYTHLPATQSHRTPHLQHYTTSHITTPTNSKTHVLSHNKPQHIQVYVPKSHPARQQAY